MSIIKSAVQFLAATCLLVSNHINAAPPEDLKVDVCHVTRGNAKVLSVSVNALHGLVDTQGNQVMPLNDSCSVGVGVCVNQGNLECTKSGLACNANPLAPPEAVELSCDDGLDNDCDGLVDRDDGDCPQRVSFEGIRKNVPASSMTGWDVCHQDRYGDRSDLGGILSACYKSNLMLACRPVGSNAYTVAAHAPRQDVLFDTGRGDRYSLHRANGVDWYFNDSWSMGFVRPGDGVRKFSCDVEDGQFPDERLCWHTNSNQLTGGFRCGVTKWLNSSQSYERIILHAD